jgi:hypothetical protein
MCIKTRHSAHIVHIQISTLDRVFVYVNIYMCVFCSLTLSTPQDGDILIDYSKNRINDEAFSLLIDLVSISCSKIKVNAKAVSVMSCGCP